MQRSQRPMVVEFVGLPGSGKTTIASLITNMTDDGRQRFALHPIRVGERRPMAARIVSAIVEMPLYLLMHPVASARLVKYALQVASPAYPRWFFSYRFVRLARALGARRGIRKRDAIVILDEGLIQIAAAIGVPSAQDVPASIGRLVETVVPELVDAIVYTKCDIDLPIQRITERPSKVGRFDEWSPTELRIHMATLLSGLKVGIHAATALGVPLLVVDASDPKEANAQRIAEWVRGLSSGEAGAATVRAAAPAQLEVCETGGTGKRHAT